MVVEETEEYDRVKRSSASETPKSWYGSESSRRHSNRRSNMNEDTTTTTDPSYTNDQDEDDNTLRGSSRKTQSKFYGLNRFISSLITRNKLSR